LFPVGKIGSNYSLLVAAPAWVPVNLLAMIATTLGILGTMGMYAKQVGASRRLTSVGCALIVAALVMKTSATSWEFVIWPAILRSDPSDKLLTESLIYQTPGILSFYGIFTLLFALGYALFGIGSLKSKVFPKWAALALTIGAPAYAILLSIPPYGLAGMAVYCAGVFGYGLTLRGKRGEA